MKSPITLICLLLFSFSGTAQYAVSSIPEELKENANAVIRNYSSSFVVNSTSSATKTINLVVTILNDKSHFDAQYVYYNRFKTVKSFSCIIYNDAGIQIQKSKKSDIEDFSAVSDFSIYEESRAKGLSYGSNQYPYTISYSYTIEYNGIRDYPDWLPQEDYEVAVEKSSFEINLPTDMDLGYTVENTTLEPTVSEEKGRKNYRWEVSNLKPIKHESYSPMGRNYLPIVYCAPVEFEVAGYQGNMSTWESFGQFIYDLNADRGELSPEMKAKVKQLTATAETPQEKIQQLYKYLQENTRYVSVQLGIGGWQTFPASYVEKNKYGDCKALTYFMKSMLKEAGVEAHATLIYNGNQSPKFKEDFTEPMFNHVILYVPSESTWLECTSTYNPPNFIGSSNENRKALLLKDKGSKLIETPKSEASKNIRSRNIAVDINENGAAKVEVNTELTGNLQRSIRYNYKSKSEEDMEKWLVETLPISGFQLQNYAVKINEEKPIVNLSMDIKIDKYGSGSGKRLFFKPNMISKVNVPEKMEERNVPIQRKSARRYQEKITYTIPEGYVLENKPAEKTELKTDFGHFISEITVAENKIIFNRFLELNAFNFPADRYNDFRDFYLTVAKADKLKLALVKD